MVLIFSRIWHLPFSHIFASNKYTLKNRDGFGKLAWLRGIHIALIIPYLCFASHSTVWAFYQLIQTFIEAMYVSLKQTHKQTSLQKQVTNW